MTTFSDAGLETKFLRFAGEASVGADGLIEGYASLFGAADQGGDIVEQGAYARSLKEGRRIKMLWQHDPREPIGTWDEVREDERGLYVRGHLLQSVARAREAAALIEAGAIDGLSIGFRTVRATKNDKGQRLLSELELWEVSLVTFPMLPQARLSQVRPEEAKAEMLRELATVFDDARRKMAVRSAR
jgi:HK97 family phage prohead protease